MNLIISGYYYWINSLLHRKSDEVEPKYYWINHVIGQNVYIKAYEIRFK